MMIEDEELRLLFKSSAEEHLENLEAGLLYLEKNSRDRAILEELLREAHTLKGDARMLGLNDIESLIHQIEHILQTLEKTVLSSEISDRLYQGLDAISKLVEAAVTGKPSGVNTFAVLSQLMGANPEPEATTLAIIEPKAALAPATSDSIIIPNPEIVEEIVETLAHQVETSDESEENSTPNVELEVAQEIAAELVQHLEPIPPPVAETGSAPLNPEVVSTNNNSTAEPTTNAKLNNSYRIDTIRVETRNLDALITQSGELTVTETRIAHRLAEIEELVALWEEWSRDTMLNRFSFDSGQTEAQSGRSKKFDRFHHRSLERLEQLGALINRLRSAASEDTARLDVITSSLEEGIRTLRLLPLSNIFNLYPRLVRDLAKQQGKEINFVLQGGDTKADKRILEEMKDPLMHMIRNCIDHGIETPAERDRLGKPPVATLRLVAYQMGNSIVIEIGDDGRGFDLEKIKQTALERGIARAEEVNAMTAEQLQSLIFAPGFSTRSVVTEISGRGVGLDVVRTHVERLKGSIQVTSVAGMGCNFTLQLGTTLTTIHVLIAEVSGITYALPIEFVEATCLISPEDIFTLEGKESIILDNQPISVARLADLLEINASSPISLENRRHCACIILKIGEKRFALLVDALVDEQNVILKPQSKLLKRVRNVAGSTILGTGEVCMVLNAPDLIKSIKRQAGYGGAAIAESQTPVMSGVINKPVVLLAEDSIAIRTQEKRILESAGYEVVTAVDGLDGLNKLKSRAFDAIISDIQMPNMDGLTLAAKIRQNKQYEELPIILVTSLASEDDKRKGAQAGANAYITKGNFDQKLLLETLSRLV